MSAITAYYLNEMNDKLESISSALAAQKFGLGEWKSSTGSIPKEDLEGRTILIIAVCAKYSSGAQMAMSFVPLTDLNIPTSSTNPNNATNKCGTAITILNAFTGTTGNFYPKLTIGENTGAGSLHFVKLNGSIDLLTTFWYTTL